MRLKSLKIALMAFASANILVACQKETGNPANDNLPNLRPLTAQEEKTVSSSNNFAFQAFSALRSGEPNQNIFISPLSISSALTMTFNGANGTTKEAMRQTLGFGLQTNEEINESFKGLQQLLTGMDKKVTVTTANSIWYDRKFELQPSFVQSNKTAFDATVQKLDFSSPAAKDAINDWVKVKTQGKIPAIVEQIRPEHVMFLVNAVYFKATWTYPFMKDLTRKDNFHLENGSTRSIDFMTQKKGMYLYQEDATKKVVDLPYGNGQFSMTLLVPNNQNTVADISRELSRNQLASWLSQADTTRLELRMPKFKLEYKQELQEVLTQLGMGEAFSNQADFSRMVAGTTNGLKISEVIHKTFVEVDEAGTEAAAATSVGMEFTSLPRSILVNRPFVFLIRERSTNAILFIGQLMNP